MMVIFTSFHRAQAQCSCANIVGSGQGAGVTNLSQVPALQTMNGGCLRIKGVFYIDNSLTWNLSGVDVYLDPGASIYINSGSTMNANSGCEFQKCDPNSADWGQIIVSTNAEINIDDCELSGANTAISNLANSRFFITDNLIQACGTGIKIFGTQNPLFHQVKDNQIIDCSFSGIQISGGNRVRINYNWIYDPGAVMTGIDINSNSRSVTVNECIMSNLAVGVRVKSSQDDITLNGIIFGGEIGVRTEGCFLDFGIYRSTIRATNEGVWSTNHQTSLAGQFGSFVVNGSYVSSVNRSAIKIEKAYGSGRVQVQNNIIRPAYDPPSFGYYGVSISDVPNAMVFVEENEIAHLSYITNPVMAPGGIYLYKCKRQNVVNNNQVKVGPYGKLNFGIAVAESPNVQAVGNDVNGGPPGMDMAAISMEKNHENVLICCNTTDSSRIGLNLSADIENCDISGTTCINHDQALYYDMVTTTSGIPQFHRGNDWSGAATTWDAYFNGNPAFAQLSFYTVDPSLLANTNKVYVSGGDPSDWFLVTNGTEATCAAAHCGHTPYGSEYALDDGEGEITGNDLWAIDTIFYTHYAAIHWDARRYLYEKLVKYPELLEESQEIEDFYEAAGAGAIGKFYDVEDGLAKLYEPPSNIAGDYYDAQTALAGLNGDLDALDAEIEEAESWELPALLAERADLVEDIEEVALEVAGYDSIIAAAVPQKLADLEELNTSIEPETDFETGQKTINALYLAARIGDDWDFSAGEQEDIDEIAAMCPLDGGRVVYEARALQEYYRVPVWNDCPPMEERSGPKSRPAGKGFALYPNPATNKVIVDLGSPAGADCRISLLDVTGRILEIRYLAEGVTQVAFPLAKCRDGLYVVQVMDSAKHLFQQKLHVSR